LLSKDKNVNKKGIEDGGNASGIKQDERSHTSKISKMVYSGPRQISSLIESRNVKSSSMKSQNLKRERTNDELQQAMPEDDKGYDSSSGDDNKDKSITASTTSVDEYHKSEFTAQDFREFRKNKEARE
jgi:hypothetical protein